MASTTTLQTADRTDAPARWKSVWLSAHPVGLVVATAIATARPQERAHGTPAAIVFAVAAFAAAWHWFAAVRRPYAHRLTTPMLPWALAAIAVNAALVWIAPVYLFAAGFLYAVLYLLLPTRAAMATTLLLSVALVPALEGSLGHSFAMAMAGGGVGASLLSGFIGEVVEQNAERRRTIAALRNAEATIAELQRDAGRLEERARIARELHDTVTQDLVGIGLHLDAFARTAPVENKEEIARIRALSAGALVDARQLIAAHRPRQLEEKSTLSAALETLRDGDGPRLDVVVDADVVLQPADEALLFRIAQEAVTNARKHARASSVAITVSMAGSTVHLDVVDDGVGFDPHGPRASESFGLESMRTRVRAARGLLGIESAPGEGTAVHLELRTA